MQIVTIVVPSILCVVLARRPHHISPHLRSMERHGEESGVAGVAGPSETERPTLGPDAM